MIKSDLVVALRAIKRFKLYSFIKILGLALGIACSLIIFLFVQHELSYDRFHEKADRIFRLEMTLKLPIGEKPYSIINSDLATALKAEFPDVENAVRLQDRQELVGYKENRFQAKIHLADPSFFNIFTFPLIHGDSGTALREANTAVLTEDMARKLMPSEDPMGKVIRINNKTDFLVTGLMKNIPVNSHIQTDLLLSFSSLKGMTNEDWTLCYVYLLLRDEKAAGRLQSLLPGFIQKRQGEKAAEKYKYFLKPLTSVYFHADPIFDPGNKKSEARYSYYLAFLGLFIMFLAVVNYINLTTANAFKRMKEVGVRKVIGADRGQIVRQFLVESMLLSFAALAVAVCLAEMILPFFNRLADRTLDIDLAGNPGLYLGMLGILVLVGLASGIYPALLLSSLRTAETVKGKAGMRFRNFSLRRFLVVFQFAVCILFLVGTAVAVRQLRYVLRKNPGFSKENVVMTNISPMKERAEAFKNELLANPEIQSVSLAAVTPGVDFNWSSLVLPEGFAGDDAIKIPVFSVDPDYFNTIGVPLAEGRGFLEGKADQGRAAIINQQAAKKFGWTSPLGKRLTLPADDDKEVIVVGVVKDFNLESLHKDIAPYVFTCADESSWEAMIRVRAEKFPGTVDFIKNTWRKFAPNDIFEIRFLDEQIALEYREDERTRKILTFAAVLAVSIACLGLFGLAAYAAESRKKEIGIRKVLGASTAGLIMLLGKEFFHSVLAANLIAWPAAYYLMHRWLQNFAFRVPLGVWSFLLAAALALGIAFLTVSYQSIRAAHANPVESLRYE